MNRTLPLPCLAAVALAACSPAPTNQDASMDAAADVVAVDTVVTPDAPPALPLDYQPTGCTHRVHVQPGVVSAVMGEDAVFGSAPAPRAVHVNFPDDPRSNAAILWNTDAATRATLVRFGTARDTLDQTARGHVVTAGLRIGSVVTQQVTTHEVHLCGLQPGRTYYYQAGGEGHWSDVQSFTTAPADGTATVNFAVCGDSRDSTDVWRNVQAQILSVSGATLPEFELFSGDAVVAGAIQSQWDAWFEAGQQAFSRLPFVQAHGNHEALAMHYMVQFAQPQSADRNQDELYFSMDYGPVHIVVLNDTPPSGDYGLFENQELAWLRTDLARADGNRARVPWIVAVHHKPPYSTSTHADDDDSVLIRRVLPPIYDQYHVDVVFNGHDHAFEMSQQLRGAAAVSTGRPGELGKGAGTVYVTAAGAGAGLYGVSSTDGSLRRFGQSIVNFVLVRATPTRFELAPYRLTSGTGTATAMTEATVAIVAR